MAVLRTGFLMMSFFMATSAIGQVDLFEAIEDNDLVKLTSAYLATPEADELVSCEGYGLLAHAIIVNNKYAVKILLDFGSDVNRTTRKGSPMHAAAKIGNMELVKLVADYGGDLNALDIRNQSPLIVAAKQNNQEAIDYLLSKKVDLEIRDIRNRTASDYALINGEIDQLLSSSTVLTSED